VKADNAFLSGRGLEDYLGPLLDGTWIFRCLREVVVEKPFLFGVRTSFGPFPRDLDVPEGFDVYLRTKGRAEDLDVFPCPECTGGRGYQIRGRGDIRCGLCHGQGLRQGVRYATFTEKVALVGEGVTPSTRSVAVVGMPPRDLFRHLLVRDQSWDDWLLLWADPWGFSFRQTAEEKLQEGVALSPEEQEDLQGWPDTRPEVDQKFRAVWREGKNRVAKRAIALLAYAPADRAPTGTAYYVAVVGRKRADEYDPEETHLRVERLADLGEGHPEVNAGAAATFSAFGPARLGAAVDRLWREALSCTTPIVEASVRHLRAM